MDSVWDIFRDTSGNTENLWVFTPPVIRQDPDADLNRMRFGVEIPTAEGMSHAPGTKLLGDSPDLLCIVRTHIEEMEEPRISLSMLADNLALLTGHPASIIMGKILLVIHEELPDEFHHMPGTSDVLVRFVPMRDDYVLRPFYGPTYHKLWSFNNTRRLYVDLCTPFDKNSTFGVRLNVEIPKLRRLEARMTKIYSNIYRFPGRVPIYNWRLGYAVAVDQKDYWCRGIIIGIKGLELNIWLLDSAEEKKVSPDEVLPLLPEHHYFAPFGCRCRIAHIPNLAPLRNAVPPIQLVMDVHGVAGYDPLMGQIAEAGLTFRCPPN